jgi:hypothetical protein
MKEHHQQLMVSLNVAEGSEAEAVLLSEAEAVLLSEDEGWLIFFIFTIQIL